MNSFINVVCAISQCFTVVMTLFVTATGFVVNGKRRFSDPQGTKTHEPIDIKLHRGDYFA